MSPYFSGETVAVVGVGPVAQATLATLEAEGAHVTAVDDLDALPAAEALPSMAGVAVVFAPRDSGVAAAARMLAEAEHVVQRLWTALERSGRGAVVLVAPGLGSEVVLGPAGFAAASGGLLGAARGWAVAGGAAGIRVNVVRPGMLSTDPALAGRTTGVDVGIVPLRRGTGPRTGQPADVAAAVVFLLSEDARYVTGAELHVDGAASQSRNSAASALWDEGLEP